MVEMIKYNILNFFLCFGAPQSARSLMFRFGRERFAYQSCVCSVLSIPAARKSRRRKFHIY